MPQALNRKIAYWLLALLTALALLSMPHVVPAAYAEDCVGASSGTCG